MRRLIFEWDIFSLIEYVDSNKIVVEKLKWMQRRWEVNSSQLRKSMTTGVSFWITLGTSATGREFNTLMISLDGLSIKSSTVKCMATRVNKDKRFHLKKKNRNGCYGESELDMSQKSSNISNHFAGPQTLQYIRLHERLHMGMSRLVRKTNEEGSQSENRNRTCISRLPVGCSIR